MRILICSTSGPGFLQPSIRLATALLARGHIVKLVSDPGCRSTVESAGIEFDSGGVTNEDSKAFENRAWAHVEYVKFQCVALHSIIRRDHPDVLIGQHLSLCCLIMRSIWAIPLVMLGPTAWLFPPATSAAAAPFSAQPGADTWLRRPRARRSEFLTRLNQARVVFKLPEVPISDSEVDADELVGDRYLLRSVPELEPFGPALPRAVHFVGALLGDVPPRSDLEEYLSNARREGRPVIYLHQSPTFTKGSFIDVVRPFIERRRLGAIIEIANADAKIYDFPRGAFVGRDVPLAQAAAGACAMVATGHPSSVLGALTNGIPMLLFPAGSGTEDMAARCELGGCARVSATETLTERAIDELLSWVLDDPGAKEAAERLRRAFSRYDSVRLGTELTEELFDCSGASYRDSPRGLG